jgi:hypothetical protein
VFDRDGKLVSLSEHYPDGHTSQSVFTYDNQGERIHSTLRVIREDDGSWTRIQDVSSLSSWTMEDLHQVAFGTLGASSARTAFARSGQAMETVFENRHGATVSRIRYVYDDHGKMLEAVQYCSSALPFDPTPVVLEEGARIGKPAQAFEPDKEHSRAVFRYDDTGHLLEQEIYLVGNRISRVINTYNDVGDVIRVIDSGVAPTSMEYEYEYEYDRHGNWTRRKVLYPGGSDDYTRLISYHD